VRTLIVGAGGIGGYFGGRLLEAGRDVTFLVRPARQAQLGQFGLVVVSPHGNLSLPAPPTVTAETLSDTFDLILLSCKSYDLEGAMDAFAPAVGPHTAVLPLLNGMRHLEALDQRIGPAHILGGQCFISATLEPGGRILHMNENHVLSFGERDGSRSPRTDAILGEFSGATFDARLSSAIVHEMWEKWVFIATLAGITCLMRASVGDIVAAGGTDLSLALLAEAAAIATANGFPPTDASLQRSHVMLTKAGSTLKASMLRDMERGTRTEAEHVLGDLLRRGQRERRTDSLLRIACTHLQSYEVVRAASAV
jgi:2-dehydropantoate 2-reductase